MVAVDTNVEALKGLKDNDSITTVEMDIRSTDEIANLFVGADLVFHLAAAHLEVDKDANYFQEVNVDAVNSMLRATSAANIRRFVHCSSVGVYGPLAELPATEVTPCNPDIDYERTKLAGEQAVAPYGA